MRLGMLALGCAVAIGSSAWADGPAPAPEAAAVSAAGETAPWDDSHMQSRYQETPRASRPRLSGTTGYGALANGGAEASEQVAEEIEFTSQRQWVQGSLSGPSRAQAGASANAPSQPIGSVHRRGQEGPRESQLRRSSVHGGRRS